MNKEYKRFLIFLAKAVVIVLCLDFVLGLGLKYAYDHMKTGERARANFVVHQSKADVVIFGSSRALYHYNSILMGDSLGEVVYNAGRPAQSILYHNAMLKMMLKRYHPKMVILDINENEFVYEKRKYDIMSSLLPYYNQDADVHALINSVKPGYAAFSWSKTLPFNSSLFAILTRLVRRSPQREDRNGYVPNTGFMKEAVPVTDNCGERVETDSVLVNAFHDFVATCRRENIPLVVVLSPRFAKFKCDRPDYARVKAEIKQLGVRCYDFVNDETISADPGNFFDPSHLNHVGAVAFSGALVQQLKHDDH